MGRVSLGLGLGVLGLTLGVGNAAYAWSPTITANNVTAGTWPIGGTSYNSSTKVSVSWSPCITGGCGFPPAIYKVRVFRGSVLEKTVAASGLSTTVSNLRAGQTYTFQIRACSTLGCSTYVDSTTSGTATLATEMWQLVGVSSINAYTAVTQVAWAPSSMGPVRDGNVLAYALYYPIGAGTAFEGKTRLAYNPFGSGFAWNAGGVRFNVSTSTGTSASNLTSFTTPNSSYGISSETTAKSELLISAFQLIPMHAENDDFIRIFFEAVDSPLLGAGVNRLYSIDSLDGLTGLEYNSDPSRGICGYDSTYQPDLSTSLTEDCVSQLEVDIDTTLAVNPGDSGMSQIRQSKVGFPVQTDWQWSYEEDSAFLVMTGQSRENGLDLGAPPGTFFTCPDYRYAEDSLFYATWDTAGQWLVEIDSNGCAIALVDQAHGPAPAHLGDQRYKMYYEDTSTSTNKCAKPLKMIFADGEENAPTDVVDFDDWDTANPIDVDFYWPSGTMLNADEESGLGDHMVLNLPAIGTDPAIQIMYLNLGGADGPGCPAAAASQGIGAAVLLNP